MSCPDAKKPWFINAQRSLETMADLHVLKGAAQTLLPYMESPKTLSTTVGPTYANMLPTDEQQFIKLHSRTPRHTLKVCALVYKDFKE